jgi:hypothetical protein
VNEKKEADLPIFIHGWVGKELSKISKDAENLFKQPHRAVLQMDIIYLQPMSFNSIVRVLPRACQTNAQNNSDPTPHLRVNSLNQIYSRSSVIRIAQAQVRNG